MTSQPLQHSGRILFAVMEYGELPELVRTAEILSELGYEITFYFAKPGYRQLEKDGALLEERNFGWLRSNGEVGFAPAQSFADRQTFGFAMRDTAQQSISSNVPSSGIHWRIWSAVARQALASAIQGPVQAKAAIVDVINFRADAARFRARHSEIQNVLLRERPLLTVLGQSAAGSELDMVIDVCAQHDIPTLIVPFAMFNVEELTAFARARSDHRIPTRPLNSVVAKLYPRWVLESEGEELLRLPGARALALELAGLVNCNPWIPCSAPVDALACESRVAKAQLARMGLDHGRLRVVGGPVHDRMTSLIAAAPQERQRLATEHGLDSGLPLLACGWPANIFPWLGERRIAYADYTALAKDWTDILVHVRDAGNVSVVVSAHPKTLEEELSAPRAAGIPVVRGGTERLIAACDFFTTLNGSSVTAWAIACCKPTVLLDCYETRYPEFMDVPGLLMTEGRQDFSSALSRVCSDPAYARDLSAKMSRVAADWGELDGQARFRLIDLARELIGNRPSAKLPAVA